MNTVYIIIGLIYLVYSIAISVKFNLIANDKGYYGTTYFWCCFFLGIPGMILVAALPDISSSYSPSKITYSNKDTSTWTCKNCTQVNPTSKIFCSGCGKCK